MVTVQNRWRVISWNWEYWWALPQVTIALYYPTMCSETNPRVTNVWRTNTRKQRNRRWEEIFLSYSDSFPSNLMTIFCRNRGSSIRLVSRIPSKRFLSNIPSKTVCCWSIWFLSIRCVCQIKGRAVFRVIGGCFKLPKNISKKIVTESWINCIPGIFRGTSTITWRSTDRGKRSETEVAGYPV